MTFFAFWLAGEVTPALRQLPYPPYGRVALCAVCTLAGLWQQGVLLIAAVGALLYGVAQYKPVLQLDCWNALRDPERRAWRRRIAEDEAADLARWERDLCWYPVSLEGSPTQIGIFGGTAVGWQMLLTTFGCSLLAEPTSVLIIEVGPRKATEWLGELARLRGHTVDVRTFPRETLQTPICWQV